MILACWLGIFFSSFAIEAKVITLDGLEYVCLVPKEAQEMLQISLDFSVLQKKVTSLEDLVLLGDLENQRLTSAVTDLSSQVLVQSKINSMLEAELKEPVAWYKQPVAWVIIGIVLGAAVTVVAYEAIFASKETEKLTTTTGSY